MRADRREARGHAPPTFWFAAVTVLAATTLGLLAAEGALRLVARQRGVDYRLYAAALRNPNQLPPAMWADPTPFAMWQRYPAFRPGARVVAITADFSQAYTINSKGLRDREHDYEKPPGITRLLALGDSFTFGSGIALGSRFTDVAEQRLPGVEIVNMGVPGYGLDNMLLAYLREGRRYAPDALLLVLHLAVTRRHLTGIYAGGRLRVPEALDAAVAGGRGDPDTLYVRYDELDRGSHPMLERSQLLSLLWYHVRSWQLRRERDREAPAGSRPRQRHGAGPRAVDPDEIRRGRTTALLARFVDECRPSGCRVIVVNIDQRYGIDYVRAVPGLAVHDLSADLHRLGETRNLRFTYDPHYNAETHAYLGERLADILRAELSARR